jgi:glutathione S-transferase
VIRVGIVLYDNPASSNAMKVRFLLAELGLEYERRNVPLKRPRPAWYLARYPFGTVPFFEDGDLELGESNAILRYLANREGRTDLYPAEPAARAAVDWALDAWSMQFRGTFFPAESIGLMHIDIDLGGGRAEDADQENLASAIEAVRPKLDIMEQFVASNGTVVGAFTIADVAFAPVLWRWYRLPLSFDPWPKVALLRDTVTARPAFAAMEPLA